MNYVFVIGTGRCGSTLVHEILARHSDVGFISNVDDRLPSLDLKGRWNRAIYRLVPPSLTAKGRLRYAPSEAYRLLERKFSPIFATPHRDLEAHDMTPWLEQRFRSFFETRARAQRAETFLHKYTGWPRAGFVQKAFGDAKFIHIVRDGRAVANSWLQMDWWLGYQGPENWQWGTLPQAYAEEWNASGRTFPVLAGIGWKMLIDATEKAKAQIPMGQWMDVRYEDVVADPRDQMEQMLKFCGLDWTPSFERALGRYHFSNGRSDAYRRDLDTASLRALDGVLEHHLERYGYESES